MALTSCETIMMVISNYSYFFRNYLSVIKTEFNIANSRDYAVSEILKKEIPEKKYFVAFGNDWSSSFSYLSERKSFTVPQWFKKYKEISLHPEDFIDEDNLGAIVICSTINSPTISDLAFWSSNNRNWKIGVTHGCYIAVPEAKSAHNFFQTSITPCQGNIDFLGEIQSGDQHFLSVAGWTTISGENEIVPEKVYVTLKKNNSSTIYYEALQVYRPDVNAYFNRPNIMDSGFSRIININSFDGEYIVGIARVKDNNLESCHFQNNVMISSGRIIN